MKPSNDPRSYRVCSNKLLRTGFAPKKNVKVAIQEIIQAYGEGKLVNKDVFYNLKWMQSMVDKKSAA